MNILRSIAFTLMAGTYYIFGRIGEYLWKHRLATGVFGGLLAVIVVVAAVAGAEGRPELVDHILSRQFAVHIGWAALLWTLFNRLVETVENRSGHAFGPWGWYGLPIVVMLSINVCNEFLLGFTPPPDPSACTWCGDWQRGAGDLPRQLKSVADLAAWIAGALVAANCQFAVADRAASAREQVRRQ